MCVLPAPIMARPKVPPTSSQEHLPYSITASAGQCSHGEDGRGKEDPYPSRVASLPI